MMDEVLKKMEEDAKNKLWDIALSFGNQVNAKRSFIYWDDAEKVLDQIEFLDTDDKILLKQHLEQKVNIVWEPKEDDLNLREEVRESHPVKECINCKYHSLNDFEEPCHTCILSDEMNSKWEPKEEKND